jgi:ankyrin repeat protein
MLLSAGSSVNNYNNDSWAPIHLAARRGQNDGIEWILRQNYRMTNGMEKFDLDI